MEWKRRNKTWSDSKTRYIFNRIEFPQKEKETCFNFLLGKSIDRWKFLVPLIVNLSLEIGIFRKGELLEKFSALGTYLEFISQQALNLHPAAFLPFSKSHIFFSFDYFSLKTWWTLSISSSSCRQTWLTSKNSAMSDTTVFCDQREILFLFQKKIRPLLKMLCVSIDLFLRENKHILCRR